MRQGSLEKGNDNHVRAKLQQEIMFSDIQSIMWVKFVYFTHLLCLSKRAVQMHCFWILPPSSVTNCVFNDSSLQEWPSRKEKKQEEEGEEKEGKGRDERRLRRKRIFKMHMKNYCKVVEEKHFFIKAVFKNTHLFLMNSS